MSRASLVVLGEVTEAPIPSLRVEEVRDALAGCECRGVTRRHDPVVKLSARAVRAIEEASRAVAPLSCAGVLLGTVSQVGDSWMVDVREALAFNATPEVHRVRVPRHAWQEMLAAKAASFQSLRVVGWYHSHPGTGVSVSEADSFVHRYFFPADWQVACVIDPERADLQVFSSRGRGVSQLGAYWVDRAVAEAPRSAPPKPVSATAARPSGSAGGTLPGAPSEVSQTSETYLKERFVERSLEKILRQLQEPPMTLRAFAMLGIMGLMLVVLIFTRVGAGGTSSELEKVNQRLDALTQRLDAVLGDGRAPEVRVRATPQRLPSPRPSSAASAAASAEDRAPADGKPDLEHKMKAGESMWDLADHYYGDGSMQNALLRYNKITDPRDVKAGAVVKIPSRARLLSPKAGASPSPMADRPSRHVRPSTASARPVNRLRGGAPVASERTSPTQPRKDNAPAPTPH